MRAVLVEYAALWGEQTRSEGVASVKPRAGESFADAVIRTIERGLDSHRELMAEKDGPVGGPRPDLRFLAWRLNSRGAR